MAARHAYIITAHQHLGLLAKLLQTLHHPQNDIYLHVAATAGPVDMAALRACAPSSGFFALPRRRVHWGGHSLTFCQLALLQAAAGRQYAYLHLLSGQDLPLKSQAEIHGFFARHAGYEFIEMDEDAAQFQPRVQYYYPQWGAGALSRRRPAGAGAWALESALVGAQRLAGVNRVRHARWRLAKGGNWCSITGGFGRYVAGMAGWVRRRFSHTKISDELYLQTLAANSAYAGRVFPGAPGLPPGLRLIDWQRGTPYVWRMADWQALAATPCLFARKFAPDVDGAVIDRLCAHVKAR